MVGSKNDKEHSKMVGPTRKPGRHLSQLGALVAEYEHTHQMTLRSHVRQSEPVRVQPEVQQPGVQQIRGAIDQMRRRSRRQVHREVRVQPHRRRRTRHPAPLMQVAPAQVPEYSGLPHTSQVLLDRVIGSGKVLVTTAGPCLTDLLKAVDARLLESKADNTWKSLQSPFNQFLRYQVEKGPELQELPSHLQLMTFVEAKIADGSINAQTGHKYIRRVRQVFDMIQRPYDNTILVVYLRFGP